MPRTHIPMRPLLSISRVRVPAGHRETAMILNASPLRPGPPYLLRGGATRRGLFLAGVVCRSLLPDGATRRGLFLAGVVCRRRLGGVVFRGLFLAGVVCRNLLPDGAIRRGLFLAGVVCRRRLVALPGLSRAVLRNLAAGEPTGRPGAGRGGAVGWRQASRPSWAASPPQRRWACSAATVRPTS